MKIAWDDLPTQVQVEYVEKMFKIMPSLSYDEAEKKAKLFYENSNS